MEQTVQQLIGDALRTGTATRDALNDLDYTLPAEGFGTYHIRTRPGFTPTQLTSSTALVPVNPLPGIPALAQPLYRLGDTLAIYAGNAPLITDQQQVCTLAELERDLQQNHTRAEGQRAVLHAIAQLAAHGGNPFLPLFEQVYRTGGSDNTYLPPTADQLLINRQSGHLELIPGLYPNYNDALDPRDGLEAVSYTAMMLGARLIAPVREAVPSPETRTDIDTVHALMKEAKRQVIDSHMEEPQHAFAQVHEVKAIALEAPSHSLLAALQEKTATHTR